MYVYAAYIVNSDVTEHDFLRATSGGGSERHKKTNGGRRLRQIPVKHFEKPDDAQPERCVNTLLLIGG